MMRSKHLMTYSLLLLAVVAPGLLGAVSQPGVIFMLIEPGSRPGGMAEAYVAQVDDAFANYWNPGAMAFNRKTQAAFMHSNWFGDVDGINDMYYEFLGVNQYFEDIGNLGMHAIFLTYGKQTHTDENNLVLSTFSSYETALAFSYANQLAQHTGVGVTFKFILSDLAPEDVLLETQQKGYGVSWAFDFGLQQRGIYLGFVDVPRLDFGLNLQNLGPDITFDNESQSDPLPLNWRMGLSYRLIGNLDRTVKDFNRFTINADMNKVLDDRSANPVTRVFSSWSDQSMQYEIDNTVFSVGGEYIYYDLIALRAGYIYDKAGHIKGPSFGLGLQYTFNNRYKLSMDFAMQQGGELTDYNKTFTAGVEF